jgi:hypothetical protein
VLFGLCPLERDFFTKDTRFLIKTHRRGNETSFVPSRRSGGRRVIENADGSEEETDTRDSDFNGTKSSE